MVMWRVPVDVDPDSAREAAARELSDPSYEAAEPSFLEELFERLGRFLSDAGGVAPGGVFGLVILALLLLAVFVVVRLRVGPLARSGHVARSVFEAGRSRLAEDYRQAAESALARGDLGEAVRERFRAIVRELEDRGVLDGRSERTVDEIAAQAGQRLPDRAGELRAAATLFDDVVYGGHHATEAGYLALVALDSGLQMAAL
jgi:hypothetical protein